MGAWEALQVLAQTVAEGRLTVGEFVTVCLPLYKNADGAYSSEAHYRAATDLFYLADDYWSGEGPQLAGTLNEDQVVAGAKEILARMILLSS